MGFVKEFLHEKRYHLGAPPKDTGLIEQDGEYYDILNLPGGFHYRGDLHLRGVAPMSEIRDTNFRTGVYSDDGRCLDPRGRAAFLLFCGGS